MLSVIIPVYNEEAIMEDNTKRLSSFLENHRIPNEIIICDNGSVDRTPQIGKMLQSELPNIKFISVSEKRAVGRAFKEGVRYATFDNIISLDMDMSTDLSFITYSLQELSDNSMVIGSKKERQRRSSYRIIISGIYTAMVRSVLGMKFNDYSMASKAYKKSHIDTYLNGLSNNSSYVIEIAYKLSRAGKPIKEIPVACDDTRKSKFNIWREVYLRFKDLILLKFKE